jgi:tRNA(Ile)-lysidine synthase
MHLMAGWVSANGAVPPSVLTVDHGLRPDSASEALKVKAWAENTGLSATLLRWRGSKPATTGVESRARTARYRLMGKWCIQHRVRHLFVAHTSDDEAETFLLRLGRGSGLDGLAAMARCGPLPVRGMHSVTLLRPLLDFTRAELRTWLASRGVAWLEDPMNSDSAFARVRVRKLIPVLSEAGISPARIVSASRHLARARAALEMATDAFLAAHCEFRTEGAAIDTRQLANLPQEIGLRAMAQVLMRVGGGDYRPRFESLSRIFRAAIGRDFRRHTLAGCCIGRAPKSKASFGPQTIWIERETGRKSRPRGNGRSASEIRATAGPQAVPP